MDTGTRWLPVVKDEGNEDTYGTAVHARQDAKDWCQDFDPDNEPDALVWSEDGAGVVSAKGQYYDFEIVPISVEV